MSVDIGDAISEGLQRTVSRNGLLLFALYYLVSVPNGIVSTDLNRQMTADMMGPGAPGAAAPDPLLGLSLAVALVLTLLFSLVSMIITIGAIRTFVSEETQELEAGAFTDNLLFVALNLIVGGIVFGILVGIGFVLLIVPGLFLLVSLFFWNFHVIVEGDNFIDGFQNSWSLTSGERLPLFALGVIVVIINAIVGFVFGIPTAFLPDVVGVIVQQVGASFAQVFALATAARTYVQLTGGASEETATAGTEHAME